MYTYFKIIIYTHHRSKKALHVGLIQTDNDIKNCDIMHIISDFRTIQIQHTTQTQLLDDEARNSLQFYSEYAEAILCFLFVVVEQYIRHTL